MSRQRLNARTCEGVVAESPLNFPFEGFPMLLRAQALTGTAAILAAALTGTAAILAALSLPLAIIVHSPTTYALSIRSS